MSTGDRLRREMELHRERGSTRTQPGNGRSMFVHDEAKQLTIVQSQRDNGRWGVAIIDYGMRRYTPEAARELARQLARGAEECETYTREDAAL